jgi:hypothetical protein
MAVVAAGDSGAEYGRGWLRPFRNRRTSLQKTYCFLEFANECSRSISSRLRDVHLFFAMQGPGSTTGEMGGLRKSCTCHRMLE